MPAALERRGEICESSFETLGAATDVEFFAEVSDTLDSGSWTRADVTLAPVSRAATGRVTWVATAGGVHAGKPRLFMRLVAQKTGT